MRFPGKSNFQRMMKASGRACSATLLRELENMPPPAVKAFNTLWPTREELLRADSVKNGLRWRVNFLLRCCDEILCLQKQSNWSFERAVVMYCAARPPIKP
jgi:hypothetical protein